LLVCSTSSFCNLASFSSSTAILFGLEDCVILNEIPTTDEVDYGTINTARQDNNSQGTSDVTYVNRQLWMGLPLPRPCFGSDSIGALIVLGLIGSGEARWPAAWRLLPAHSPVLPQID
jgi:hypothetical protein